MTEYVHNLKIALVDKTTGNIVVDEDYLDEVKRILCQRNTRDVDWNSQNMPITLQWHRRLLTAIGKHFMGDLFLNSIYNSDLIIVNHVAQMLAIMDIPKNDKNANYSVQFYIFRLCGEKRICPDSFGVV